MPALSSNSQIFLLKLARDSIRFYLETRTTPLFEIPIEEVKQPGGCFVTLKKLSTLRGCIGTFEGASPLHENVIRMAVASAFEDPRFPPVCTEELHDVRIELSVLGELRKMNSLEELEIGRHGIWIKFGGRAGTYLPDVAVEQGWSREEFLEHCAYHKAGLTPEEFKSAEIFLYEVQKFSEAIPD